MSEGDTEPDSRGKPPRAPGKFDAGDWVSAHAIQSLGRLPLLSALLGALVGVVGVVFFTLSELVRNLLFGSLGGLTEETEETLEVTSWYDRLNHLLPSPDTSNPQIWMLAVVPAVGGLLLGLWYWRTKDKTQAGTEVAVKAFHQDRGRFQKGNVWKKFIASTITLGTGGAAGREGPIALMGASIGSNIADWLKLTQRQRRILLVAGLAAGIGGMFRAPLAGGLIAAEVLYSDAEFEPDVLIPATIASIISYCVFCLNFGWGSLFGKVAANYQFTNPLELVPLTALALALAATGFVFVKMQHTMENRVKKIPRVIRPMLGAGIAGGIAIGLYYLSGQWSEDGLPQRAVFAVMGDGYSALKLALSGGGIWWVFLLIAGGKILASSLTIGTGGAGGYFAPSMVIGGCVGAAIGILFYQVLPTDLLPSGMIPHQHEELMAVTAVFALVGMAGFWTGVAKVPVSSVIIVSELTGSYHLLLPAMWTCAITFVLARRYKLFLTQVANRKESPAHVGDFAVDVLKEIRVAEILPDLTNFDTVDESTSLQQILAMKSSRQHYYPVVDRDGRFAGIFSLNDLRTVLDETELWQLLVAADIAHHNVVTVHPRETLGDVANKFADTDFDEFPVVSDDDERNLLGIISRRQLNNAYIKRTMHYDQVAKAENARPAMSGRLEKVSK
ncbi:MAG: chloride channel protein [Planctomycetes bacterium]|nr:chloride channel protein [Planctomycetota bacterium]